MKTALFKSQSYASMRVLLCTLLRWLLFFVKPCMVRLSKSVLFFFIAFHSHVARSQTIIHYGLYSGLLEGAGKDLVKRSDNPGHYDRGFFVRWSNLQNDKLVLEGGLARMTFPKTKLRSGYSGYVEMEGTILGILYKLRSYRSLRLYGTAGPTFLITDYYEEKNGQSNHVGGEGTKIGAYFGSSLVGNLWKNKANSLALEFDTSIKYMIMDGFNKQALSVSAGLLLAMDIRIFR